LRPIGRLGLDLGELGRALVGHEGGCKGKDGERYEGI